MQSDTSLSRPDRPVFRRHAGIIVAAFILSRVIIHFLGLNFKYSSLYDYWQYLDVTTLKENLLAGVWYDHTQPPVFNLFLGIILKISPEAAAWIFAAIFKLVTLANALLLLSLTQKITKHAWIPLAAALFYLLSPGTIVFENELFYTSLITLLFLLCIRQILTFRDGIKWRNAIGFFLPLTIICLTRSMYHIAFLAVIAVVMMLCYRKQTGLGKLLIAGFASVILVSGWYIKNYVIFHQFSASSWLGMNMARNIFHDNEVKDSTKIESIPPFSPLAAYKRFATKHDDLQQYYSGKNDRDLMEEFKNDSFMNMKHYDYIQIAELYKQAGIKHIKEKPVAFAKNVVQSAITFFAPATRYTLMESQAEKIKYYDAVYSLNVSHFAKGKSQRRIALVVSAIPQILLYLLVTGVLVIDGRKNKKRISPVNLFIALVLLYAFSVSSLVEHYENMRFRFELSPLFIILMAQAAVIVLNRKKFSGRSA